jgi:uncharacterized peroxidase-related enzyme
VRPLDAKKFDELEPDLQALMELATKQMGFAPNDVLLMAHWPELLRAVGAMVFTIWQPGEVSMELKRLVGLVASNAAGCQYCVAHNAHGLARDGVSDERQTAVWQFDESPLFTAAERAALRVARGAGKAPNEVDDHDRAELRRHYTPRQTAEIVAVIGMFGFLNRWNATLQTVLEAEPEAFAAAHLGAHGWRPGGHSSGAQG